MRPSDLPTHRGTIRIRWRTMSRLGSRPTPLSGVTLGVAALGVMLLSGFIPLRRLSAQEPGQPPVPALEFADLEFSPPEPERYTLDPGVEVFVLEDHTLPLVSIYARFKGGPSYFLRSELGAATAVPILLRSSGTADLSPDSVDKLLEFYATQTTFGGGGGTSSSSINMLTRHLDAVLPLWGELLKRPAFDADAVEVWRGQELEDVRRRQDTPGRLAVSKFNHLLFGDHPIGWEFGAEDLEPEDLTTEVLRSVHRRIYCFDNLTLGVTGDVSWQEMRPKLEALLVDWPSCDRPLIEPPSSNERVEPGVYVVPRPLEQSTVVIGRASTIRLGNEADYFSSRIGNAILGGSGMTSRLVTQVRTEQGLAYSAASVWTAPRRSKGIIGAITQSKSESTVAAIRAVLGVLGEMSTDPPDPTEVNDVIDRIVNGFVFNFENAGQIVSRQMLYSTQDLPLDWLTQYLAGIQDVTAAGVEALFREHLSSSAVDDMVILVVGDPARFDPGLEELGPVRTMEVAPSGPEGDSGAHPDMNGGDPPGHEAPLDIAESGLPK